MNRLRLRSAARFDGEGPRPRRVAVLGGSLILALAWLSAAGCGGDPDDPVPGNPSAEGAGGAGQPAAGQARPDRRNGVPAGPARPLPTFTDVAEEAGIAVMNHTGKPSQKDWIVSGMGATAIAFDFDSDGDMDLFIVDGTMLTEAGELVYGDEMRSRLFRNEGGMRFREVTKESGIDLKAFGFGGASADYDADGHPDLYVCCWGRNHLLRNRGDGTFEDVTDAAGLAGADRDMSTACAWGDVNGDGVLDLYVANYSDQYDLIERCKRDGLPARHTKWRGHSVYVGPSGIPPQMDRLYLANGDGTFREVTETNLTGQIPLFGFQPVMSDLDQDGDLDIFVANDTHPNHLWLNDGKGVFKDVAVQSGSATNRDMSSQACMGVDVADFDRDGWLDITVTNFSHDYNTIYLNKSARSGGKVLSFVDSTHQVDLAQPSHLRLSWGVRFFDYDCDGELDYFASCGHVYGEIDGFEKSTGTSYRQRCQILRSNGQASKPNETSFKLTETTDTAGPAFQIKRVWRGATFADFDDDGDQDVWVGALNDVCALFRNDGGNANAFLRFRLEGKGRLRSPAGVRVTVTLPDGRRRTEELHHGASFCSDNDPRLFFGCGTSGSADVEVLWPGGEKQTFTGVATSKAYRLTQGGKLEPDALPGLSRK